MFGRQPGRLSSCARGRLSGRVQRLRRSDRSENQQTRLVGVEADRHRLERGGVEDAATGSVGEKRRRQRVVHRVPSPVQRRRGEGEGRLEGFVGAVDADERDTATALDDVGYTTDDIDVVVQSHLHLDHAGGLFHSEGTDVPVYLHRRELEHAYLSAKSPAGGIAYVAADFDRDLNWQVVHGDRQLLPGIELLHLPGHSPGLLGAHIERGGTDLLVAGDEAFLAENYEDGREMGSSLVYDSRAWARSRRKLRDIERRTDATVLYGHDADQFRELRGSL